MYKQMYQSANRVEDELFEGETKKPWKNPWGVLSETWGQNDSVEDDFLRTDVVVREQSSDVKERLGLRSKAKKALTSSESTSIEEDNAESSSGNSDEEWCKRNKSLRMRMHADDEEEKMQKKRIKQYTEKMYVNMESKCNDLRLRLDDSRKTPVYCEAIKFVVTDTSEKYRLQQPYSRREDDNMIVEVEEETEEKEDGEWMEENDIAEKQDEIETQNVESDDSDISEKEVQGPRGSVIKVVPRVKPRVASTVWARLNNKTSITKSNDRPLFKRKLAGNLKGDLRSRLGNHNRGRSPLRIEVKNDKYAEDARRME